MTPGPCRPRRSVPRPSSSDGRTRLTPDGQGPATEPHGGVPVGTHRPGGGVGRVGGRLPVGMAGRRRAAADQHRGVRHRRHRRPRPGAVDRARRLRVRLGRSPSHAARRDGGLAGVDRRRAGDGGRGPLRTGHRHGRVRPPHDHPGRRRGTRRTAPAARRRQAGGLPPRRRRRALRAIDDERGSAAGGAEGRRGGAAGLRTWPGHDARPGRPPWCAWWCWRCCRAAGRHPCRTRPAADRRRDHPPATRRR